MLLVFSNLQPIENLGMVAAGDRQGGRATWPNLFFLNCPALMETLHT
jgi:hypothetical protein